MPDPLAQGPDPLEPRNAGAGTARFPQARPRRLRRTPALRDLTRETTLRPADFVYPVFVTPGRNLRVPIGPMPGQAQVSVDNLVKEGEEAAALGIRALLLFGLPSGKDATGTGAYAPDGVVQQAVAALKSAVPDIVVMTDVCLCEYTDHGHCGTLRADGSVANDETLDLLAQTAVSHAEAGADVVAPSAMMDGQVAAIRSALDADGWTDVAVMAYASKMASAFYGPFRAAADSAPQFGDRKAYQMDGANAREAMRELRQDADEGADILMVKPALAYLDIVAKARAAFDLPIAAYNVSGEYAMLRAAAANGWLDERAAMLETLASIKRAGADIVITYFAKDAARLLREEA